MKKNKLLLLVLLAGFAFSCKDTFIDPATYDQGFDYYPLAKGDYRIYSVTDINFKNNIGDTSRFQMREVVDTSFTDQTSTLKYKIIRATRKDEESDWVEDSVLVVSKSEEAVLLTKNNTTYVSLVFPVKEGKAWLGDAYNNRNRDDLESSPYDRKEFYTYTRVGEPFRFDPKELVEVPDGGVQFDQTATVVQGTPQDNFTQLDDRKEVYARGIGRVYRRFNRVVYCNESDSKTCPYGVGYKLNGNERHEILVSYGHN
ncbi:hypothetical protein [Pontibacter chitinilyticus]|uniref:hypothetical protein n=1 Tax=Pontibacter chitinilyticus TaxID=2674989 RepID=UPI00321AED0B